MESKFDAELDELSELADRIKNTTAVDRVVPTEQYLARLNKLLAEGWDYALGKENEIDEDLLPKQYLNQRQQVIDRLQSDLGRLAERYRSLPENSILNDKVIEDYQDLYRELVRVNGKIIALDPDSELPDRLMPKEYVDYWLS